MGRTRESANLVSDKNIFVDIANDLVGIGTTAPTATLEVSGTLAVSGISTFQNNVDLGDDDKLRLGTGNDLEIYHNGSNSFISDVGTGILVISGSQVQIKNAANTENCAKFFNDGAVELYYDNSKKFETTGAGATFTGIATATTLFAQGGTFSSANDTESDAAIVITEESAIYSKDGGNLRVLMEKKSDRIHIGQLGTVLIDGIDLRPGTTGGSVRIHSGGSSDNIKLETTGAGVTITGICSATSFSGDGANLTNVPTGFSPINFVLS